MTCESGGGVQLIMAFAILLSWLIGWAAFDVVRLNRRRAATNGGALLESLPYLVGVIVFAAAFAALLDDFVLRVCAA